MASLAPTGLLIVQGPMNAKVTDSKAERRKDLIKIQSNVNDLYFNLILLFSFVAENNAEIIRLNPLENKERRHQLHPLIPQKMISFFT